MAGTGGHLDDLPVAAVGQFERELIEYMNASHRDVLDQLRASGKLEDEIKAAMESAIAAFKSTFKPAAS